MNHSTVIRDLEHRLANAPGHRLHIDGYRAAAVCILITDRNGAAMIPLTVRSKSLRNHSGQISLPGGSLDSGETVSEAAIREANEELAIPTDLVRPIGTLGDIPTPTGFVITPVVAELTAPPPYEPNPAEVAEVFEAPLALFADESNRESLGMREWQGVEYELIAFNYGKHQIWGATARILEQLAEHLR